MSYSKIKGSIGQYNKLALESEVNQASPHRLVQMLLEGALEKIAIAKGFIQRNEISEKNAHISWAISIISGLRMSLDKGAGGEIAQNLDDLYDYMCRRLLEVTRDGEIEKLDEVTSLILEIKSAWDAIPASVKGQPEPNTEPKQNQSIVEQA